MYSMSDSKCIQSILILKTDDFLLFMEFKRLTDNAFISVLLYF